MVGTALVENSDYLMFTGSTATGQLLAEQAGRRLIGFSAELGGKNPMIVTAGANLRRGRRRRRPRLLLQLGPALHLDRAHLRRAGRSPPSSPASSATRVRNMTLRAGYDFGVEMGSLISEEQVKAVSGHVDDAMVKGANVIAGGKARPDLGPLFYEPTVLTDVPEDAECCRDETFGPLVSIYPVGDVDEAVERANDTEYGLNASVWAAHQARG